MLQHVQITAAALATVTTDIWRGIEFRFNVLQVTKGAHVEISE